MEFIDNKGGLSPDSMDIDNAITCDNDYPQNRENSHKMSSNSEDDSQMACDPSKKDTEDSITHSTGKKRRRSHRANHLSSAKRGRRPTKRFRHSSDSEEDTSDHSLMDNTIQSRVPYHRGCRSERLPKYDFRVNLACDCLFP